MSRYSEYNANQSLNETAKANKRMAHNARARHEMPEYEQRQSPKLWRVLIVLYSVAVIIMFLYGNR